MRKTFLLLLLVFTPALLKADDLSNAFSKIERMESFSHIEKPPFPMESLKDFMTEPKFLEDKDPSKLTVDATLEILSEITGAKILKPLSKSYVDSTVYLVTLDNDMYEMLIWQKWEKYNESQIVVTYGNCTPKQLYLIIMKLDL